MNVNARQRGLEGRLLGGLYRLGRVLGEGGMGIVYEATHEGLRRPVAVKVLSGVGVTADAVARFQREAQAAALLGHPNIVQVTDFRSPSGGEPAFLVMEHLRGRPWKMLSETAPFRRPASRGSAFRQRARWRRPTPRDHSSRHQAFKPFSYRNGVWEADRRSRRCLVAWRNPVSCTYRAPSDPSDGDLGTLPPPRCGRAAPSIRAVRGDLPPAFSGLIDAMLAKDANHRVPSMAAFIGALEPLLPQLGAPPVPLELQGTMAQTTPPMTPGPAAPLQQGPLPQQLAYSPSAPYAVPLGVATTGGGGVAHTAAHGPKERKFPVLVVSIPMLLAVAAGGGFLARRGVPPTATATATPPTAAAPSSVATATNADALTTLAPLPRPQATAPAAPPAQRRTSPELPVAAIPSSAVPVVPPPPEPAAPAASSAQTGPGAFWARAHISVGRSDAAQTYLERVTPRFTACGPGAELRRRAVPTDPEEYSNYFERRQATRQSQFL
ncbi:hypothetical protein OUZ56_032492 [Daphnia magna]|uniref:NEK6-subfamily protein kinase n=1 Tax=Daphnia magna TaxID=35525 RepID=A0ABR0B922_9CRUS|nr:hypothetical protein OUZ56_032492 [Daphnia magna]